MTRPAVAVVGAGVVSPAGRGVEALWSELLRGAPFHEVISHFDAGPAACGIAGFVPGEPPGGDGDAERLARLVDAAVDEALEAGDLAGDTATVLGTTFTGGSDIEHAYLAFARGELPVRHDAALAPAFADRLAAQRGWTGPTLTTAGASASGAVAIGTALDLVRSGDTERAVAVGADVVTRASFFGLNSLRTLHAAGCRPFSAQRRGIHVAEAAVALVLGPAPIDAGLTQPPLGYVLGYGQSNLGANLARPDVRGLRVAVEAALQDAGVGPAVIGYVNAHGPGTRHGDAAELAALEQVFGDRFGKIPVSSCKGVLGHCQGAAGAIEALATLLCLRHRVIPPTGGVDEIDEQWAHLDLPIEPRPAGIGTDVALSISCGLGGVNTCLVLARAPVVSR